MKLLVVIILLSFGISCSGPKTNDFKSEVIKIQLNPEKEKKIYLSEIVDSIFIIPLETSNQSLLTGISKIDYDDEYYFVLNSNDKLVYVFDSYGRFKCQVANKGNGPGEIMYPQCFALDKINKEVWLTNNNSFYRYSYQGDYLGNKPYSLAFSDFTIGKNGSIYFYTGKDNNAHIDDGFLTGDITMLSADGEKTTWFKSDAYMSVRPGESVMSYSTRTPFSKQDDGKITCHYVFSDTIYSIDMGQIVSSYAIDLGENKSKVDLEKMPGLDVKEYIQTHSNTVWYIRDVVETSEMLRFSYNFGFETFAEVYFNKRNGHILEGTPINDLFEGNIWILGNKDNKFIGYIYATDLKLDTKLSSFISPQQISELKNVTMENNPILIEFKLKSF